MSAPTKTERIAEGKARKIYTTDPTKGSSTESTASVWRRISASSAAVAHPNAMAWSSSIDRRTSL